MRLPRMTTRRWMLLAVAVVGLLLGGSLAFVRLKTLSRHYAGRAINANVVIGLFPGLYPPWSHDRWLAECRRIEEEERKWIIGTQISIQRPLRPDVGEGIHRLLRAHPLEVRASGGLPWLPLEPDPPRLEA